MIQLTSRRGTLALALAVLLAVAVAGAGGAAYASHRFSDVATGTFFHESSGAIFDAGCADGYPNGTFRPDNPATRGQFGFWTHNCASRATFASTDPGVTGIPFTIAGEVTISSVTIEVGNNSPGAATGKTQFVHLTGTMTTYSNSTLASFCQPVAKIYEGGTNLGNASARMVGQTPGSSITVDVVVPATNGSHTYTMKVANSGGNDCTGANVYNNGLSAVTSTFGSTGAATLSTGGGAAPLGSASPPAPPAP